MLIYEHALSTTITVLNSSDRTISGLQVMYLDRTGLRHESARFSIAPGDKKRIENLPETPNEGQDNVLIAIFSEDGSIQKGRDVGIPKGKVFQHYCNDGTVAIGLSVP